MLDPSRFVPDWEHSSEEHADSEIRIIRDSEIKVDMYKLLALKLAMNESSFANRS